MGEVFYLKVECGVTSDISDGSWEDPEQLISDHPSASIRAYDVRKGKSSVIYMTLILFFQLWGNSKILKNQRTLLKSTNK